MYVSPVERKELLHEIKLLQTKKDLKRIAEVNTPHMIPSDVAHLLRLGASLERTLSKSEIETIRRAADEVRIRVAIVAMLGDGNLSPDRKLDNLTSVLDNPTKGSAPFALTHFPGGIVCSSVDTTSIILLPHIFPDSDIQIIIDSLKEVFKTSEKSLCWIIDFSLVRSVLEPMVQFLQQISAGLALQNIRVMVAWVNDSSLRGTIASVMKQQFQLVKIGAYWFSEPHASTPTEP